MKEVNIIPDDAKSIESLKQLEQVWSYFIATTRLFPTNFFDSLMGFK